MATRFRALASLFVGLTVAAAAESACGGSSGTDEEASNGQGGGSQTTGGSGGAKAGTGGVAGGAGASGKGGGNAGTAGTTTGGSGGASGASGGAGTAGTAGKAGASGSSGSAGTAGSAGASGTAGNAGTAGASGSAGKAGASGSAGTSGSGGASGSAGKGGTGGTSNDGGLDPDAACVADNLQATLTKKPVDIIVVIDNSGSMTGEIQAVQSNINTNFADILAKSGLDYRVIMISRHGTATVGQSICISSPLSGTNCSPVPAQPVNGPRFFHYSVEISSVNSLSQIIASYSKADEFNLAPMGFKQWLRSNAYKVFLEITDDNSTTMTAAAFETQLLALDAAQFGTAAAKNYIFHSIVGLKANTPATAAWPATAPEQTTTCGTGAVNPGSQYQKVSISTGGLRFPICNNASFDVVFQTIADGVVSGSKIECALPIPPNPPGKVIDPSTIQIEYTAGTGQKTQYNQVKTVADCTPSSFYIETGNIHLCPAVCTTVQADSKAALQILFGCGKL